MKSIYIDFEKKLLTVENESEEQPFSSWNFSDNNDLLVNLLALIEHTDTSEALEARAILMRMHHIDADWEWIRDYASANNLSRQGVYERIKSGKLETEKFGTKFLYVKERKM